MLFEIKVFDASGNVVEDELLVGSNSDHWADVLLKVITAYPEYAGRRMSGGKVSKGMFNMPYLKEMKRI